MTRQYRLRLVTVAFVLLFTLAGIIAQQDLSSVLPVVHQPSASIQPTLALLNQLEVKGRAPKTGYSRSQFGDGWREVGSCDTRNIILARDLTDKSVSKDCKVLSGTLNDPYTGKTIYFRRGADSSDDVQIDHVVALSDAWQKGAMLLTYERRESLANDPLNLLAVDGGANQQKSDSDAASWLPPNKRFRCQYVTRQVKVKAKYTLWVTVAEKAAIAQVLNHC